MIKVSIVIPVYNVDKYLRQAIDSAINQTLKDIEIICINDGSTDNSLKILQEYAQKDNRIKIFNQANQGAGVARNFGISKASGKYIMFLDPDDWYTLDACETAYNQIERNNNDLVIFNFNEYINESGCTKTADWRLKPFMEDINNPALQLKNYENYIKCAFTWSQIYSRKFLIDNDVEYSSEKLCEDVPFYIKAFVCSNTVSIIQSPLYFHRMHQKSMSFAYKKHWRDLLNVRYQTLTIINNSQNSNDYIYPYLIYAINSLLYWFGLVEKDKLKSEKEFYGELRNFFIKLNNEFNISSIKNFISYKKFYRICKYSWEQKNIIKFLQRIFSIGNSNNHKIINLAGIKLKFRLNKERCNKCK